GGRGRTDPGAAPPGGRCGVRFTQPRQPARIRISPPGGGPGPGRPGGYSHTRLPYGTKLCPPRADRTFQQSPRGMAKPMSAPNKQYDPVEVTALSPEAVAAALQEGPAAHARAA